MQPMRHATKRLEGDTSTASLYVPLFHAIQDVYSTKTDALPVPPALREIMGKSMLPKKELMSLAAKFCNFLGVDTGKVMERHLAGTSALPFLKLCTYLDPRFKGHACLSVADIDAARASAQEWAAQAFNQGESAATDALNRPLAELLAGGRPDARGRAGGRGRGRGKAKAKAAGKRLPCPKGARRPLLKRDSSEEFLFGVKAPAMPDVIAEGDQLEELIKQELASYDLCTATSAPPEEWWHPAPMNFH